jgi:anti-anti-sigma factor
VVVDLSACTFIDSSLVALLLRAARVLGERNGTLPLVVGSEARSVHRVLDLMGITTILSLHDSRAAALGGIPPATGAAALPHAA